MTNTVFFVHSPDTAYLFDTDLGNTDSPRVYVAQLERSELLCFDGTASLIWDILQTPHTLEALTVEVAEIFEVQPQEIANDVSIFIDSLQDRQLIQQQTGPSPRANPYSV